MSKSTKRGRPKHDDILTPAEWRVVEAVRHGMTSRQIAKRRGISIDAVKYHVANVLQKLGLKNRAELRLWNGVARHSALHAKELPMKTHQTICQIGQISRNVKDIKAACEWYTNVLGLTPLYSFGDLAFFDCNGLRLFLNQCEEELPSDSIIYFRVDDIRVAHTDMQSRGILFLNAPHMIHKHEDGSEEWMAFFNDLDNRPLAIMAQHKAEI